MKFNHITLNGRALHTGEVAGSIPAAPTITSICLSSLIFSAHVSQRFCAHV
jgi:hypothetical protein